MLHLSQTADQDEPVEALRAALAWAAGAPGAPPHLAAHHLPRLVALLDAHRLGARFLRRVRAEGSAPFDEETLRAVEERLARTTAAVEQRIATARRLADRLRQAGADLPLVLVKGFTLYGLTGDPCHIRRSGDLDVVADEPRRLTELLRAEGFVPEGELDVLDEYCRLRHPRDGLVEVHSHVRVPRYPEGGDPADVAPGAHPGDWWQPAYLRTHQLGQRRLAGMLTAPGGVSGLPLLRPEAALVAQSCHAFGDYVMAPLPLPEATVRLDEIAAVADLAGLPGFEPGVLAELVDGTGAHDALAFVRSMAVDLLGKDPLAHAAGLPQRCGPRDRFPVDLWWDGVDGYLADLGWDPGQLLVRDRSAIPAVLDRLGAPVLRLAREGDTCEVRAPGDGSRPSRSVHRAVPGHAFDVRCRLVRQASGLTATVSLPAATAGTFSALSLNFGDHRYECFYEPDTDRFRHDDYSVRAPGANGFGARRVARAGRDVFEVELPWAALGEPQHGVLPLLLGVRHQRAGWGRMLGGAVLPLRLGVHHVNGNAIQH